MEILREPREYDGFFLCDKERVDPPDCLLHPQKRRIGDVLRIDADPVLQCGSPLPFQAAQRPSPGAGHPPGPGFALFPEGGSLCRVSRHIKGCSQKPLQAGKILVKDKGSIAGRELAPEGVRVRIPPPGPDGRSGNLQSPPAVQSGAQTQVKSLEPVKMALIEPADLLQRLHAVQGAPVRYRDRFEGFPPGITGCRCRPDRNCTENTAAVPALSAGLHGLQEPLQAFLPGLQVGPEQKGIFRAHKSQPGIGRMGIAGVRGQRQQGHRRPLFPHHLRSPVGRAVVHYDQGRGLCMSGFSGGSPGSVIVCREDLQAPVQVPGAVPCRQDDSHFCNRVIRHAF